MYALLFIYFTLYYCVTDLNIHILECKEKKYFNLNIVALHKHVCSKYLISFAGHRSVYRDVECQIALVTQNKQLQAQLHQVKFWMEKAQKPVAAIK